MQNLVVTLGGKPLETREELQKLRDFIDLFLDLTDTKETVEPMPFPLPPIRHKPNTPAAPADKPNGQGAIKHNPAPGERKIDYAHRALEEEARPMSIDELFNRIQEYGWRPQEGSKDPVRALEVPLYQDKKKTFEKVSGKWCLVKWRHGSNGAMF